jgi:5-methylcytosine-specific restriction endonuclease McrA
MALPVPCKVCGRLTRAGARCERCRPRNGSTRAWRRLREIVLARDQGRCQVCGAPAEEIDHIRPVIEGGTDDLVNLRAVCFKHNPRGGAR